MAWRASDTSAADWRYKSMQFIRQMVFYHLSMKESVTIFLIFHLPLLSWQLHKVAKNNNGELVSSSRQFCTWHIFSQKWKKKHPVKYDDAIYLIPIRLLLEKWNVFLPYKKRILICKIDLFTRSWVPKKMKGHPSSWFIHWAPLTWKENFVLYEDSSLYEINFPVLNV